MISKKAKPWTAVLLVLTLLLFLTNSIISNFSFLAPSVPYNSASNRERHFEKQVSGDGDLADHSGLGQVDVPARGSPKMLAWVLHFNHKPHLISLKFLMEHYARHFQLVVIVSPTGRPKHYYPPTLGTTRVFWTSPCSTTLEGQVAMSMLRCYARGLQMLTTHPTYQTPPPDVVQSILFSNDDVLLNMTKIKEVGARGLPAAYSSPSTNPPELFTPAGPNQSYFDHWQWSGLWPKCQEMFLQIPAGFKERFTERHGRFALKGGADIFILPKASAGEFLEVGGIVGDCWCEISITNTLAMLSIPVNLDTDPGMFLYNWRTITFGQEIVDFLKDKEFASYHPFKLSNSANQIAFHNLSRMYNLN